MKKHEFYGKYANIPLSGKGNRFLKIENGYGGSISPDEIYTDIKKLEQDINIAQRRIETLLEFADKILL